MGRVYLRAPVCEWRFLLRRWWVHKTRVPVVWPGPPRPRHHQRGRACAFVWARWLVKGCGENTPESRSSLGMKPREATCLGLQPPGPWRAQQVPRPVTLRTLPVGRLQSPPTEATAWSSPAMAALPESRHQQDGWAGGGPRAAPTTWAQTGPREPQRLQSPHMHFGVWELVPLGHAVPTPMHLGRGVWGISGFGAGVSPVCPGMGPFMCVLHRTRCLRYGRDGGRPPHPVFKMRKPRPPKGKWRGEAPRRDLFLCPFWRCSFKP